MGSSRSLRRGHGSLGAEGTWGARGAGNPRYLGSLGRFLSLGSSRSHSRGHGSLGAEGTWGASGGEEPKVPGEGGYGAWGAGRLWPASASHGAPAGGRTSPAIGWDNNQI